MRREENGMSGKLRKITAEEKLLTKILCRRWESFIRQNILPVKS